MIFPREGSSSDLGSNRGFNIDVLNGTRYESKGIREENLRALQSGPETTEGIRHLHEPEA